MFLKFIWKNVQVKIAKNKNNKQIRGNIVKG